MGKSKYDGTLYENLDQKIRQGESAEARQSFLNIPPIKVQRNHFRQFARLSGRLNCPDRGIRLLRPLVRTPFGQSRRTSIAETVEYADLLTIIGAKREAIALLNELEGSQDERVWLYKSYIQISNWDYDNAANGLEKYLESDVVGYDRLVAELNLGYCYAALNLVDKAAPILEGVALSAKSQGHQLIYGNALGNLGALLAFADQEAAKSKLELAAQSLTGSHLRYRLYIERWQAYIAAKEGNTDGLDRLREIAQKSKELSMYETARDSDLLIASLTSDHELGRHIYMGTPYAHYRNRILSFVKGLEIPTDSKRAEGEGVHSLDLFSGTIGEAVNFEGKPLDVLRILNRDFYRALPPGELFSEVFEGEHYDPDSSRNRVFNLISRLKKDFDKNTVPFDIGGDRSSYSLILSEGASVTASLDGQYIDQKTIILNKLKKNFGDQAFRSADVEKEFEFSIRSTRRALKDLKEQKLIRSFRQGRVTYYQVVGEAAA